MHSGLGHRAHLGPPSAPRQGPDATHTPVWAWAYVLARMRRDESFPVHGHPQGQGQWSLGSWVQILVAVSGAKDSKAGCSKQRAGKS